MAKTKLIVQEAGVEAQFRLKPKNEEQEEGEISDDDDELDDNTTGQNGDSNNKDEEQVKKKHISLSEMQSFLIALILPEPRLSTPPQWCRVLKCMKAPNVGIFLLDNADIDWIDDPGSKFTHGFKFETSPDWIDKLISVPLSRRQQSLTMMESNKQDYQTNLNAPIKVAKTDLLLSPIQMMAERFPSPSEINMNIIGTSYEPVTDDSPVFAVDCEMCLTVGNVSELTRISIIDEEMKVVYNELVKPDAQIVDYLTRYSGITENLMRDVTTKLEDVHKFINDKLPRDSILCGHSLNSDLKAMKIFHPYVIDTSVIYNKSGNRSYKPSLKSLAYEFLQKDIQTNKKSGHDSLEDAITAMELLKLKMVNGKLFGDTLAYEFSQGVAYDHKTGNPHMSIDKFIDRQQVVHFSFRHLDTTPNARFLYVHDNQGPPTKDIKETMFKLLDDPLAICVVLLSNGDCYVKI